MEAVQGPMLESYRVLKRIAEGGYGIVDQGVGPDGEPVAMKQEPAREKVTRPTLEHEYRVYQVLAGHESIPHVRAYGRLKKFNVMVMDLLGPSLENRFKHCAKRFSLRTTARLGLGILDAVEYIHSRGFIHRDIKPDNFLLGRESTCAVVHVIDFGLARRWRHSSAVQHFSPPAIDGVIGTLCFASINAHLGKEQTRRDDLHSLVYTILYFARGGLPWEHIRGSTEKHSMRRVLEKKRSWNSERLCQNLPHELEEFASYCFGLKRDEEPDYHLLREKLTSIANREGWNTQAKFEWDEPDWKESSIPDPPPVLKKNPPPLIKRGDVVLLRLEPEKSLDFEYPPRVFDPSFFPHDPSRGTERQPPYRPAVVHKVTVDPKDDLYFSLEVYALMRRNGLDGIANRRKPCFQRLETLAEIPSGKKIPSGDIFVYDHTLRGSFKVRYDQVVISSSLCVPEPTLAQLEGKLRKVIRSLRLQYDSDDEETRSMIREIPRRWYGRPYVMNLQPCDPADLSAKGADLRSITGWNLDMIDVYKQGNLEDGCGEELDDDSDSDFDKDLVDFPLAVDRRLSCTLRTSAYNQSDESIAPFQSNAAEGL